MLPAQKRPCLCASAPSSRRAAHCWFLWVCKLENARRGVGETQETELVAAGFPCVDVSRAGLRKGLEGKVRGSRAATSCLSLTREVLRSLLHAGRLLLSWTRTVVLDRSNHAMGGAQ